MSSEQQDDPNRWNAEQRVAFLVARGIEDAVSSCTDEEQRALIMSFLDTDKVDASPDDNDGGGVWRTTGSPEEVPGERGAGSTEEDLDGGLEEVLSSFCAITACDRAQGKCMLEAMGWDLDTAVMMYMDEGDNTATRGSSAENNALRESLPVGSSSSSALSAAAAAAASLSSSPPYPPRRYDAGNHSIYNQFDYPQLDAARNQWGDDDDGDNDNGNGRRYDNYDEAGVRMPDPIRQQRLLGPSSGGLNGAGMGGMMLGGEVYDSLSRAEEPNVDWLFPPPRHLSFPGTYKDARELARQDKKWLLINIQNHEVFESHMLNRDTWANETVEALLRNSFIFWQRGSTSVDARSYMLLHNVADEQLPHIAVVDARTGSKIHVMKVSNAPFPSWSSKKYFPPWLNFLFPYPLSNARDLFRRRISRSPSWNLLRPMT